MILPKSRPELLDHHGTKATIFFVGGFQSRMCAIIDDSRIISFAWEPALTDCEVIDRMID